jgi:GPH family glycoside/pentoside/hexuronide:cation symporter
LLFGSIPFALTFILLWIKPTFVTNETGMVIFFAAAYLIYEASATTVYMPYFALTPELTQDYDERTQLTSFRMMFNIIGGLVAYTLPMMVIGSMIPENANRVVLMGAIFGAVAALPYLLVFFGVRERPEYMQQEQPRLKESLQAARRNKPFLFAAFFFCASTSRANFLPNSSSRIWPISGLAASTDFRMKPVSGLPGWVMPRLGCSCAAVPYSTKRQ